MDVKETKEALVALVKLGKEVAAMAKDGIDLKDAAALGIKFASDEKFRGVIIEAISGAAQIPAEVKDISFEEGVELALAVIGELQA
jgi:hypothetical protein